MWICIKTAQDRSRTFLRQCEKANITAILYKTMKRQKDSTRGKHWSNIFSWLMSYFFKWEFKNFLERIEFCRGPKEITLLFALVNVLITFKVLSTLLLPHVQSFSCFVVLPNGPAGQCFALLYLCKRKKNELDVWTKVKVS